VADLCVIVPTRGRPDNLRRLLRAWSDTDAWQDADLTVALDADDPERDRYAELAIAPGVSVWEIPSWEPMVPKLNAAAVGVADRYVALGFAGDDHVPRTRGWARTYLDALDPGPAIVYGDDGYQGERLPTQWAMSSDIVRTLGRMVPAPVEHLYCDDAILALGRAADCIRYLPDVLIEHMHPFAKKSAMDDGYRRVNAHKQYQRDRALFAPWHRNGLARDVAAVRALRT
jgi:hypothetical protein